MKSLLFIFSLMAVMGLAFWAYSENYKTKAALDEVQQLQREIGGLLETRAVLRAEWAYLNRPDRLRDLASINFERLELVPLQPGQFGLVDQIAYPPQQDLMLQLEDVVDVIGTLPAGETVPTVADDSMFEPLTEITP